MYVVHLALRASKVHPTMEQVIQPIYPKRKSIDEATHSISIKKTNVAPKICKNNTTHLDVVVVDVPEVVGFCDCQLTCWAQFAERVSV